MELREPCGLLFMDRNSTTLAVLLLLHVSFPGED